MVRKRSSRERRLRCCYRVDHFPMDTAAPPWFEACDPSGGRCRTLVEIQVDGATIQSSSSSTPYSPCHKGLRDHFVLGGYIFPESLGMNNTYMAGCSYRGMFPVVHGRLVARSVARLLTHHEAKPTWIGWRIIPTHLWLGSHRPVPHGF